MTYSNGHRGSGTELGPPSYKHTLSAKHSASCSGFGSDNPSLEELVPIPVDISVLAARVPSLAWAGESELPFRLPIVSTTPACLHISRIVQITGIFQQPPPQYRPSEINDTPRTWQVVCCIAIRSCVICDLRSFRL